MPMQVTVPAGAEGASAAKGRAASGRCGLRTSIPSPDGPDKVLRSGCPSLSESESCMRDAARAALGRRRSRLTIAWSVVPAPASLSVIRDIREYQRASGIKIRDKGIRGP
jgi:hypothetical protein